MQPHYDAATPLIPAQHQPAVLVEHLRSLDLDAAALLAGTGLAPADLDDPGTRLTPSQYLQMLRQALRLLDHPEAAFTLGQQALPGHFGAASHALLGAPNLRRALQVLAAHPARLSPLLLPHLLIEEGFALLYWTDACAAAGVRASLVEMQMAAVAGSCAWLAGARLPWQFLFNRTRPRSLELHEVHLGSRLRFDCHLDGMLIDAQWLDRPWPNPRAARTAALAEALDREAFVQEPRRHLLALLYEHLADRVREAPSLDDSAQAFGISAATLKRRLALHGTHYQAELDMVRLHAALRLMHCRGYDNEAVGRFLGIEDPTNFRRSMKRWAGLTPAQLRLDLARPLGEAAA